MLLRNVTYDMVPRYTDAKLHGLTSHQPVSNISTTVRTSKVAKQNA